MFCVNSCIEQVDDFEEAIVAKPVVNALLIADSTISVHISMTTAMSATGISIVDNATVIITNSLNDSDTLKYCGDGMYSCENVAKEGVTYNCTVYIPGHDTIMATTSMPFKTEVSNIQIERNASRGEEGEEYVGVSFILHNNRLDTSYWDLQMFEFGRRKYYVFEEHKYYEGVVYYPQWLIFKPEADPVLMNEAPPLNLISNCYMNGSEYKVQFYFSVYEVDIDYNAGFSVELRSVSKSYYEYQKRLTIYESAMELQMGVGNNNYSLYSNVKNGNGIFASCAINRKELTFE